MYFPKIQKKNAATHGAAEKIMLTPTGENLNQEVVEELSTNKEGMLIMCGRYEGVDERFIEHNKLRKISIGNYVLSGGETAAYAF